MRKLIYILLFIPLFLSATTVRVGSNGDVTSISSVPSLSSGDSVLFKCGETFKGTITTEVDSVYYGSYGIGNKPVITGLDTLTVWDDLGSNLYRSYLNVTDQRRMCVVINSEMLPPGRYPNFNTTDGGMLTKTSSTSSTITDDELTGSWIGGEVVRRAVRWRYDKETITNQVGTTITHTDAGYDYSTTVNGYFIQRDLDALDLQNEWQFQNDSCYIYSTYEPTNVMIATLDYGIDNSGDYSNITIDGLKFEGFNYYGIYTDNARLVTINECDFENIGVGGIYNNLTNNLTIDSCDFSNMGQFSSYNYAGIDTVNITNCSILNVGKYAGLGADKTTWSNTGWFWGIHSASNNFTASNNTIDSVIYDGITFAAYSDNQLITGNTITNFCLQLDDGGAIYTVRSGQSTAINKTISNNTISNASSCTYGLTALGLTTTPACGIYIDDYAETITVSGNSISNINGYGIFSHNTADVDFTLNTITNCFVGFKISNSSGTNTGNSFTFNTIINPVRDVVDANSSITDLDVWGTIDFNTYRYNMLYPFKYYTTDLFQTKDEYKSNSSWDLHSTFEKYIYKIRGGYSGWIRGKQ